MTNWIEKYQAGKIFLQPNSSKLPSGYKIPYKDRSSELAISIGGENGEPAYLIPSFKYGIPLSNPIKEFNKTGEHLGGPFKTWQEADKWEREIRHPYVEKEQAIPTPIRTWGKGVVPFLQEGKEITRTIPEITVYGKKNYLQELDKQQQKYLADMAKYKQDSAEWAILNNKYKDAKKAYEDSLKLHNWTQLYKEADFNRPAFETLTNDEALDYIATTGDRNRADVEKIGFLGTPFLNPKRGTNPNDYNNYYGGVGHTWGTKDIPSKYFEDITEENKKIIGLFKKQKIKPSHFINTDNPDSNDTGSLYPIYDKPKGQLPVSPIAPAKPTGTNIKYDSTYENLRMRPLWATMAKQDTTSKIGTLNPLDPLYEKGFTYREAQKFPEEIRKQYKLDYPIDKGRILKQHWLKGYKEIPTKEQGGAIPKAQEGVKIQADRRNWLQRTNDKIQTTYNKNKPQLLKDFPLLDLPGMMVEYVTGHSKDPDAGLAMVNPVGKIGKAIKVHQAAGKFKAKEKGINFVKNWIEHPESQKRINEITDLSDAEALNQAFKNTLHLIPTFSPWDIRQFVERKAFLMPAEKFRKDFGILGSELFSVKNLSRGYLVPKSRILNKGNTNSTATGLSWGKGNFWIARESPRKKVITDTIHEATHNITSNQDNIKIKKLVDEAFGGESAIEMLKQSYPNYVDRIKYLTDPTEVYARIMELRNQFNLKPGQIVDKKLGEKIFTRGMLNKTPVEVNFFGLMNATRQDLPKRGGAWFTDLFNKLPATVPIGIVGSSMYMNNQNKDKE